jgi:hypothetical protein
MGEIYDNFLKLIQNQNASFDEVEKATKTVLASYKANIDKLSLDITKFGSKIAVWIKENYSSKFLPYAFKLIINLYELLGFLLEFNLQDYYKTSDKEDEKDPKELEKSLLEGFDDDKDNIIGNPLLSSDIIQIVLSLLDTMVHKKMHITHKTLLTVVLPIISLFSVDKKVQTIIRKKKFLKMLLKIFKDVLQTSQALSDVDVQICCYILHTTAKLTYQNKKNQEYLIKKKGYEYIKGVIATSQDLLLLQGAICTFANLSENADARLMLWCGGNLPILVQRVKVAMINVRKNLDPSKRKSNSFKQALKDLELSLLGIWKLSIGTDEVIEDCFKNKDFPRELEEILEWMEQIKNNDSFFDEYMRCLSIDIAILRRFASSTLYRAKTVGAYMKHLMRIPKFYEYEITNNSEKFSFLFKEIAALLGVMCLEKSTCEELLKNDFIPYLIKISLLYFDSQKLIKTTLGCLTNINAYEFSRDYLCKEKEFYVLLFNVLDKYDYLNLIIDYALKMILNTSQNEIFYKNYISSKFYQKMFYLLVLYSNDDFISTSLIKIFRILCSRMKGLENFLASIKEYEELNPDFDIVKLLADNMKPHIDDYTYCIEIILFLSTISQTVEYMQQKIKDNQHLCQFLKEFIGYYKDKPDIFRVITGSVACLPLEEFNAFL